VIYLDTSVALAHLLSEDRHPPASLWKETLVSSRLLEFELWTRLNARKLGATHGDAARVLLSQVAMLEMVRPVLERALEPLPGDLRTLDALHLASVEFLRANGQHVSLASYDDRLTAAAIRLKIPIAAV
jgi:predicted nucleic acid-binding protein